MRARRNSQCEHAARNRASRFLLLDQAGTPAWLTVQGCIKLLDFSLSSIGWRRGLGRGGAFSLVAPLLGPLPTRSSRGEVGELDAALADHAFRSGASDYFGGWP